MLFYFFSGVDYFLSIVYYGFWLISNYLFFKISCTYYKHDFYLLKGSRKLIYFLSDF